MKVNLGAAEALDDSNKRQRSKQLTKEDINQMSYATLRKELKEEGLSQKEKQQFLEIDC